MGAEAFIPVLVSLLMDGCTIDKPSKIQAHNNSIQISVIKALLIRNSVENKKVLELCCNKLISSLDSKSHLLTAVQINGCVRLLSKILEEARNATEERADTHFIESVVHRVNDWI